MRPGRLLAAVALLCPLLTAQSPVAHARNLASPDWRARNTAALALERLPAARLPVDTLLELLGSENLPKVQLPYEIEGPSIGIGRAAPEPGDRLWAGGSAMTPDSPASWVDRTPVAAAGSQSQYIPSEFPRLLLPMGSEALLAYVLRRCQDERVVAALDRVLLDSDRDASGQAARSLTMFGSSGRARLEQSLSKRSDQFTSRVLAGLLHSDNAVESIAGWLDILPVKLAKQLHLLLPEPDPDLWLAAGSHLFQSRSDELARYGAGLLLKTGPLSLPFLQTQLESSQPVQAQRALALAGALGAQASGLAHLVLPLVDASAGRAAVWAPQTLVLMQPSQEVAASAAGALARSLGTKAPEEVQVARLRCLGLLKTAAEPVVQALRGFAETGSPAERRAALDSLITLDALRVLGEAAGPGLADRLGEPGGWIALIPAIERLPLGRLAGILAPGSISNTARWRECLLDAGPTRASGTAEALSPWLDAEADNLHRLALIAAGAAALLAESGLDPGLLDSATVPPERLSQRIDILLEHSLATRQTAELLLKAVAAAPKRGQWNLLIARFGENPEFSAAAIRTLMQDSRLKQIAGSNPYWRFSIRLAAGSAAGMLRSADPLTRAVGRAACCQLQPLPAAYVKVVEEDLLSGSETRRRTALAELRHHSRLHPDAAPHPRLVDPVQRLAFDQNARSVSMPLLERWSR